MMTQEEQNILFMELLSKQTGRRMPDSSESMKVSGEDIQKKLHILERTNHRLREQLSALKARNEELETYVHTVSHALKNPLSVIIVTAEAISDIPTLTPEELQDFTEQIQSTAYEMNDIVDNLLLLSEVRKADMPVEPLDMARIVATVRSRLSSMVKEYRGQIIVPRAWPAAIGYAPWIEEVWVNYISNALKYGGQPPRIELGASIQSDGMVRFWVRDKGPGILPENQSHLFNQFTQLGQVHKPGHGLGLSIVRRIIEKSGGRVDVESAPGKGSSFFFTLPAPQPPLELDSRKWDAMLRESTLAKEEAL